MSQSIRPEFEQLFCLLNLKQHVYSTDLSELLRPDQQSFLRSEITRIMPSGTLLRKMLLLHDSLKLKQFHFSNEPADDRISPFIEVGLLQSTPAELAGILTNPTVAIGINEMLSEYMVEHGQLPVSWTKPRAGPPIPGSLNISNTWTSGQFVLRDEASEYNRWKRRFGGLALLFAPSSAAAETIQQIEDSGWLIRLKKDSSGLRVNFRNPIKLKDAVETDIRLHSRSTKSLETGKISNQDLIFKLDESHSLTDGFLLEGSLKCPDFTVHLCTGWFGEDESEN